MYWVGTNLDSARDHKWFVNTFVVLSVVTGATLVVIVNFVYYEHAKIGPILSYVDGRLRYPFAGGMHESSVDEVDSILLLKGTLRVRSATVHRQNYPLCQLVVGMRGAAEKHLVFTSLTTGHSLQLALSEFAQHAGIEFESTTLAASATEIDIPPPRLL